MADARSPNKHDMKPFRHPASSSDLVPNRAQNRSWSRSRSQSRRRLKPEDTSPDNGSRAARRLFDKRTPPKHRSRSLNSSPVRRRRPASLNGPRGSLSPYRPGGGVKGRRKISRPTKPGSKGKLERGRTPAKRWRRTPEKSATRVHAVEAVVEDKTECPRGVNQTESGPKSSGDIPLGGSTVLEAILELRASDGARQPAGAGQDVTEDASAAGVTESFAGHAESLADRPRLASVPEHRAFASGEKGIPRVMSAMRCGGNVVRVRPMSCQQDPLNSSKFSTEDLFGGLHPMYPATNVESSTRARCEATFARAFSPLLWYYRCLGLLNISVGIGEVFEITAVTSIIYAIYFVVHMSGLVHFVKGMMECVYAVNVLHKPLLDAMIHTHLAGIIHLITVFMNFITLTHVRYFPIFFNSIQEMVIELSGLPTANGILRAQRRLAVIIIAIMLPFMVFWGACAVIAVSNNNKTTDLEIFNPWWSYVYIPVMLSNLALETFSFTFYLFFGMLIARYVSSIAEAIRRLDNIVSGHQVRHLHRMHVQIITQQRLLLHIFGTHVLVGMGFAAVTIVYVVFHSVEVYEMIVHKPLLSVLPVAVPHVWMLVVSWLHLYVPCYVSDLAQENFYDIINLLAQIETNDDRSLEKTISRYQEQISRDVALVNVSYFKLGRPALLSAYSAILTNTLVIFAIWNK